MRKILFTWILVLATIVIVGQIPPGYYNSAQGLTGEELRTALHNIIKNHTVISYNALWNAFKDTDKRPDGKVWDIYSTCNFTFVTNQCGTYSNLCDCYNREHTVPQSWFNNASPMVSDLFHILPTDGKVNAYRSNYPYGECANGIVYGLGKLGTSTSEGYTSIVFEPADEYKGDIARIYFYMATRYMNVISGWNSPSFSGNNLSVWTQNMLVRWHQMDPVSQKEIDRNNAIYSKYQQNRNPFVDHPEWVYEIWGTGNAVLNPQNFSAYPYSPTQINLIWNRNSNNDDILLAFNTTNSFGTPQSDNTLSGPGTVLAFGQLNSYEHTNLTYQTYYYKIWSKNSQGTFSTGVVVSATPYKLEPQNHVTNFRITATTTTSISLAWTDATGNPIPDRYLILASEGNITPPIDGTPVYDGALAKNINFGEQSVTFFNLQSNTTYNFSIFPYTNYGSAIDYKILDAPVVTGNTLEQTAPNLVITEVAGMGFYGDQNDEYIEISNLGWASANLNGYTLEYHESGLEASLNLNGTLEPNSAYVIAARTTHTSAIQPNFVPAVSFTIDNPCYVVLKYNGAVIDQAGSPDDLFNALFRNFEFVNCGGDNLHTTNWLDLGAYNGTPGVVRCATSLQENYQFPSIVVYPVPSSNVLNIESSSEIPDFYLVNGFGQVLRWFEKETSLIDVSWLPSGIYFLRFSNGSKSVTFLRN